MLFTSLFKLNWIKVYVGNVTLTVVVVVGSVCCTLLCRDQNIECVCFVVIIVNTLFYGLFID